MFDARSTGYDPIVSDELYKEHLSSTLPAFVETEMTDEFKDCFVIEIPLPHAGGSLKLSTDAEDIDGSGEIAMRRFQTGTGSGATATATIANGQITAISVGDGGSGYSTAPAVLINRLPAP